MMFEPDVCFFHKDCTDGFAAAYLVHRKFPRIQFIPATYGDTPSDVTGLNVLIVDFSYKLDVIRDMAQQAKQIMILDHHKTAAADLAILFDEELIIGQFDMDKSGVGLVWDYYYPNDLMPLMFQMIQDRDLWKFEIPGSQAFHAYLLSLPFSFSIWDSIYTQDKEGLLQTCLSQGDAILRRQIYDAEKLIETSTRYLLIGGITVPVVNCPFYMASDVGSSLSKGNMIFAATYHDTSKGRVFSLRSDKDGMDVSEIAKLYGGGGHHHAAGFTTPHGWDGDASEIAKRWIMDHHTLDHYVTFLKKEGYTEAQALAIVGNIIHTMVSVVSL